VSFESGGGIEDAALRIEASFDQNVSGADRLWIFGHERPLLRES
jgi:hypothetical protein